MPIFSYFAVMGSVLVALLFAADATLDKRGPLNSNSEFAGLPKAWHAADWQPETKTPVLVVTPAPAPDMKSEAVVAAAPPPVAKVQAAAAAKAEAVTQRVAKLDAAPRKPRRVVRRPPHPADDRQNYAWRNGGGFDSGFFGGGNSMFGRF
jgi:hypothetical protein